MAKREWKIINRQRQSFERKYNREFRKLLMLQIKPVLDWLLIDYSTADQKIQLLSDNPITKGYISLYSEVGKWFAVNEVIKWKGFKIAMDYKQEGIYERIMENYVLTELGATIVGVTDTTKNELIRLLQPIINDSLAQGYGIEKAQRIMRKELSKQYGKVAVWRARRIAQTEIISASNQGTMQGAISSGLDMVKTWLAGGSNVRDSHATAASVNVKIPRDQKYVVGSETCDYPGQYTLTAKERVNCKCAHSFRAKR